MADGKAGGLGLTWMPETETMTVGFVLQCPNPHLCVAWLHAGREAFATALRSAAAAPARVLPRDVCLQLNTWGPTSDDDPFAVVGIDVTMPSAFNASLKAWAATDAGGLLLVVQRALAAQSAVLLLRETAGAEDDGVLTPSLLAKALELKLLRGEDMCAVNVVRATWASSPRQAPR